MKEELEIEYKTLLNEETYNQILENYKDKIYESYIQINYYLSHPILNQKKYMLRIRKKKNTYELTLKRPLHNHRLETNIPISKETKDKILNHQTVKNEIMDILFKEGIQIAEIENKFSLTTYRTDIHLNNGILSLDKNEYLGMVDFELEYEVNNEEEGFKQFLEIIQPYSIQYHKNCDSKIKRVLAVYNS